MISFISLLNYFIYFIGLLFLLYHLIKFTKFIYNNCNFYKLNLTKKYGKNTWCLIVGASDGIGNFLL